MHSIVCIKYALDVAELKIDPATRAPVLAGATRKVSDIDKNAIEEAVRIKEKVGGKVSVVTMGSPEAKKAITEAIAMGADEGYLVTDPSFDQSDTMATSYVLAAAIKKIGDFNLIICGEATIDGYTAQVGPSVAERLNLPQITYARRIVVEGDSVTAERDLTENYETTKAKMPVLITVTKEINEPRLPTLMSIMKASKKEIKIWGAAELGVAKEKVGAAGSSIQVLKALAPEMKRKGVILKDIPAKEAAMELAKTLVKEGIVKG